MIERKPLNLLDVHASVQIGTYFDKIKILKSGAKFASSKLVADYYWNYAYNINVEVKRIPEVISEIREYSKDIKRDCVLYFTPDSKPESLPESLNIRSFEDEVWMVFDSFLEPGAVNENLNIERIPNTKPSKEFMQIFNDAYGSGPPDSPGYEGLPPEYVQSLENCSPPKEVDVCHFIGKKGVRPVAISSIYCSPPYAGLYNVGTAHFARRLRYGWDLSVAAVKYALDKKCSTIFLQTQADSPVEELYAKIGFKRLFEGRFLML